MAVQLAVLRNKAVSEVIDECPQKKKKNGINTMR